MKLWALWFIAGLIFLIVEMLVPSAFFFTCFGLGAVAAGVAAFFGCPPLGLWAVFIAVSLLLVLFARPIMKPLMKQGARRSNVDELIGKEAMVTREIAPHAPGLVRIGGETWKAESSDVVAAGERVRIARVEGTKLHVVRKEP